MATVASVKAKIQGLIDKANKTTNRRDLQLSPAFDALIEGYGRGDSGGIIDVTELPEIDKAKEGYVYRLISETPESAEIWMAVLDGNSTHMETLQRMFENEGIAANTTVTIVSALPSTMQPINEATLTIPLYVLESTGVAYLSLDGTNANVITLGQLFEGVDGGWIRHINEIYGDKVTTVPTFFCLRVEGSTETKGLYIAIERVWYYYKRIIDVEKLPTGADNNAIYRVGKYVTKDLYICLAGGELRPFVDYVEEIYGDNANLNKVEFVDALPSPHETATLYILNTTGAMYTDVNGTLEPYGNDALAVMMFGTYYGLCDADAVDLNYPGLYAVREGIVIEKYCVKVGGKWIEFKSKSTFQEYAAGGLTEIKGEDLLGVTLLADHALANCKSLEKATIPSNVANIGDSAFENCENLKEIVFHDNLMGIGNRAFYGCKSIEEIDWYSLRNLWDLGQEAFAYCTSLKHAAPTADDNGGGYIFNANPSGMFDGCTALETATIDFRPDAGWLDCSGMFAGCTSLHTFTDNVGMSEMPDRMFSGCSSLQHIYVPFTKANWATATGKGEKWDQGTPDYVIHCTDGDILKSDAESGSDDRPDVPEPSGMELNIAYGDTPPEDTTKLWVKTSEPSKVTVSSVFSADYEDKYETLYNMAFPNGSAQCNMGCAVTQHGQAYTFGSRLGSTITSTIYNIAIPYSKKPAAVGNLPTKAEFTGAACVGSKIYVFGGRSDLSTVLNTIYVFDTDSNTISTLGVTLPEPLFAMGCVAVGEKIYLFGGNTSDKIYCFNTSDETITTLAAKLPRVMAQMAYAGVGTKIYLFGGWGGGAHNTILVFDTVTEQIETLSAVLPKSLFMACAATVGTNIYIFGGTTAVGNGNQNYDVYVFDTVSQTVRKASITISQTVGSSCFAYQDKIYVVVGCQYWTSSSPFANNATVYIRKVTPAADFPLAENEMFIRTTATDNIFYLVNAENVKIENGIQTVYKGNADGKGEVVEAALYKDNAWTNI